MNEPPHKYILRVPSNLAKLSNLKCFILKFNLFYINLIFILSNKKMKKLYKMRKKNWLIGQWEKLVHFYFIFKFFISKFENQLKN